MNNTYIAAIVAVIIIVLLVTWFVVKKGTATPAIVLPTPSPTPAPPVPSTPTTPTTPSNPSTPSLSADGSFCTAAAQCTGGFCNQFTCKSAKPGSQGSSCSTASDCDGLYCTGGVCSGSPLTAVGGTCTANSNCVSNNCVSGKCAYLTSPTTGQGCDPTLKPASGLCQEAVYGSGEYFVILGGGLTAANGSCPSVHSFIQPSAGNATQCYYPRPIGAPCTSDDMCPGWTSTSAAGSLCVTGTCVHPAGFISGTETCDPYVGPFCGDNSVCVPGSNGAANTCQKLTTVPEIGSLCDFSGGTCGGDGAYMCSPVTLKCQPTGTLQFATNGFGVPVRYTTEMNPGQTSYGAYFASEMGTNPNTKGYTGTDMINACMTNPTTCVAAGFISGTNYWPIAPPTTTVTTFPASSTFYPNTVY